MTPLERAARALHDRTRQFRYIRDCTKPELPPVRRPAPFVEWDDLSDEERAERIEQARAVLTAIREPSEGMEQAIAKAVQETLPLDSGMDPPDVSVMVDYGVSKAAVAAMIDAALAEGV